ncbi:SRPBCC family protein [Chitinophaga polysaccharea]|uniref:SRPBCC family protein n=1 Tax=Chitinophaga polysaccharea TaxID=1293035 RepID=UPI00115C37C7|nr:SRPBCC domain-containing protein [Chitinophaga polysaccharea]
MSNKPLVFERTLDTPVSAVWEAITDKNKMKHWYFDLKEFKPQKGFEFSFMVEKDNKQYIHLCKITEVITGKKLSYTWKYQNEPGDSEVTWELFPEGDKTKLKLTHTGIHTFAEAKDPAFDVSNFNEGWTYILGTSLPGFLAKEKVSG